MTWPLEHAAFATFGWIGVGNTNLEIWAAASNADLPADCPFPLVFQSKDEHGEPRTNFTNAVVLDVSADACCVFFCEWDADAPIVPWQKGVATHERRANALAQMSGRGGGPLGLIGLREITLTVRDLRAATAFLAERDLLEVSPAGETLLCSKACGGLEFRFVEPAPT